MSSFRNDIDKPLHRSVESATRSGRSAFGPSPHAPRDETSVRRYEGQQPLSFAAHGVITLTRHPQALMPRWAAAISARTRLVALSRNAYRV